MTDKIHGGDKNPSKISQLSQCCSLSLSISDRRWRLIHRVIIGLEKNHVKHFHRDCGSSTVVVTAKNVCYAWAYVKMQGVQMG